MSIIKQGIWLAVIASLSLSSIASAANVDARNIGKERVAVLENCFIRESSGICASRRNPGIYWTHNDSGSGPFIFAFNEAGKDMGTFRLCAGSEDIEDIAAATINGEHYLMIGNIGNNGHGAASKLYLIKEPAAGPETAKTMNSITKSQITDIPINWPGGEVWNCESLALSSTGEVFLATKSYPSRLFRLQLTWAVNGSISASKLIQVCSYPFKTVSGAQTTPTGMDISPDGRSLAFVIDPYSGGRAYEFTLPAGESWATANLRTCPLTDYGLIGKMAQPEAICYSKDGKFLYATSEGGKNRATKVRAVGCGNCFPDNGVTPLWKITRYKIPTSPTGIASLANENLVFGSWATTDP